MLEKIKSPKDIKNMDYGELNTLCSELRSEITGVISQNGGHLASNLGFVEATVAIHRVFDLPSDKLIFDVGHQCYAHKLLTGRADMFSTIRKKNGLSGFTNRHESEYDAFTAGHSGPSVSSGLGIAKANKLCGSKDYVVSVVGDGSFTNGLVYEALNNCDKNLRFIIILNDNEMSISSNVGNLSKHLSRLRTSKKYFKFKHSIKNGFSKIPCVGKGLIRFSGVVKDTFKRLVLRNDDFFSALGVKYLGPVDGHDIRKLEIVLDEAKKLEECCIVLLKTRKGKGYEKAESSPESYHSVGKFNPDEGVIKSDSTNFSEVFGEYMVDAAAKDEKIAALTAAMCEGTGLLDFSKKYPDRFFDVGIAEEHEVAFAAGLSAGGMKPVCAIYSTFSQRVYDQAFHDLSVQGLPCVFALDRAGFVPDDGITHQGLFDVSLFSSVPNTVIFSPETYGEMKSCFDKALSLDCLSVVRYPKGSMEEYDRSCFVGDNDKNLSVYGEGDCDVAIVTYGRVTHEAYKAAKMLENDGKKVRIIKLVKIYPLDFDACIQSIGNARLVYILEEGIKSGGIGEKLSSYLCGRTEARVIVNAVDNRHAFHASVSELYDFFGMTADKVYSDILSAL